METELGVGWATGSDQRMGVGVLWGKKLLQLDRGGGHTAWEVCYVPQDYSLQNAHFSILCEFHPNNM